MTLEEAYRILGLAPGAGADDVKKAYRRKALESHPDRFQDETQKAFYQRRFMDAREAYAFLRAEGVRDLPEEEVVVPEMGAWIAGRSFAPTASEPVGQMEKLGLRLSWSPETALAWIGGTLVALAALVYVLRFLVGVIRGDAP